MAGGGDLGNLIVRIQADATALKAGLNDAQKAVKTFSNDGAYALQTIGAAFAAMAIAATAAIAKTVQSSVEWGEQLERLSKISNSSAYEMAQWQFAVAASGASVETLNRTFPILAKNMQTAATSGGNMGKAFRDLGVEVKNNDGSLKSVTDVMLQLADGVSKSTDKTLALAQATLILGRGGKELLPMLAEGRAALQGVLDEFDKFGMTRNELNQFAQDSAKFHDQWVAIEFQFKLAGAAITQGLMPSLMEVVKSIRSVDWVAFGQAVGIISEMFVKWALAITTVSDSLSKISGFMGMAGLTQVGAMLGTAPVAGGMGQQNPMSTPSLLAPGVGPSQSGMGAVSPGASSGGGGQGPDTTAWEKLKKTLDDLNKQFTLFGDMQTKLSKTFNQVWTQSGQIFGDQFAQMIVQGKSFTDGLKESFQSMAMSFISAIVGMMAQWVIFIAAVWALALLLQAFGVPIGSTFKAAFAFAAGPGGNASVPKFLPHRDGAAYARMGAVMARRGLITAAQGLSYGGDYFTGSYGESGIPAVLHPGEMVTPISKFYDFVKQVSGNTTININGANQDPRQLAELVALEVDRKRRNP
jgi:hypothetical protein